MGSAQCFIHTVKRHRVPLPAKMRSVLAKVNIYPLSEYINVTNSLSMIVIAVILFAKWIARTAQTLLRAQSNQIFSYNIAHTRNNETHKLFYPWKKGKEGKRQCAVAISQKNMPPQAPSSSIIIFFLFELFVYHYVSQDTHRFTEEPHKVGLTQKVKSELRKKPLKLLVQAAVLDYI